MHQLKSNARLVALICGAASWQEGCSNAGEAQREAGYSAPRCCFNLTERTHVHFVSVEHLGYEAWQRRPSCAS